MNKAADVRKIFEWNPYIYKHVTIKQTSYPKSRIALYFVRYFFPKKWDLSLKTLNGELLFEDRVISKVSFLNQLSRFVPHPLTFIRQATYQRLKQTSKTSPT